jgi:hypothetical protein
MFKQTFSLALAIATASSAATEVRDQNLLFGAVVDGSCDVSTSEFGSESAALAAVAAKFALNALVGFGSSLLDSATEAATVVRSGTAPGYFYGWQPIKKSWQPQGKCVRFWYGLQRSTGVEERDLGRYGVGPAGSEAEWSAIVKRWAQLGLVEQPYLYGEVRLLGRAADNLLVMQPVVLFARSLPETTSLFRKPTKTLVAIDLKPVGEDASIATQLLELPNAGSGSILIRGGGATKGLASAWAALPAAPNEPPKDGKDVEAGPFTAVVTFTSSSDGTLFGKTMASTFKAQKEDLVAALTPEGKAQKAENRRKATEEAFDAVAAVLDAKATLDKADEKTKPRLELDLRKAQYLANLKLQAAGLPARYPVTGP